MSTFIGIVAKHKHSSRKPSVMEDQISSLVYILRENNCLQRYVMPKKKLTVLRVSSCWERFARRARSCDKGHSAVLLPNCASLLVMSVYHHRNCTFLGPSAWISVNRLQTGVDLSDWQCTRWDMPPIDACKCEERQTTDNIITTGPIYSYSNGA